MLQGSAERARRAFRGLALLVALAAAPAAGAQEAAAAGSTAAEVEDLVERVDRLRAGEPWLGIPDPASATRGSRSVAAGERVTGDAAVSGGTLEVYGVVEGDAVAYGGDVVVHPGGEVRGDAIAVLGRVRLEGGAVGGEIRSVRGSLAPAPTAVAAGPVATVRGQLGLVGGWLAVLLLMGVGVLVFASGPLAGVVETLERGFGRALAVGVAGQLALLPVLLLGIVALAATIIGILLIPFAVVAYALAAVGLMMLGFLAVARVTGGALARRGASSSSERGVALRALVTGILLFVVVWVVAALLTPVPLAAVAARAVAFALSWVAVSAGFGAAILSRAGTRRTAGSTAGSPPEPEEELSWQTPTPIGGVAAARRPASTSSR